MCTAPTLARASEWAAKLSGTTTFHFQFDEGELETVGVPHIVLDTGCARRNLTAFERNGYVAVFRFDEKVP
jgi:hypothetical protein